MYENGKKLTKYAKKRKHIDKQKQRFLHNPFMGSANGMTYEQYVATRNVEDMNYRWGCHNDKPWCKRYWCFAYLTGPRQYAKDMTNSAIRNHSRHKVAEFLLLNEEEWDDFDHEIEQHNGYQKHFDYWWTIY